MDWNTYWTLISQTLIAVFLLGFPVTILIVLLRLAWSTGNKG